MSEAKTPFWRLFFAVSAASMIGYMSNNSLPIMVGGVMDGLHLSEQEVGTLFSIQMGSVAAGAMLLSPWVARVSRASSSLTGAVIAALGYLFAAFSHSSVGLAAALVLSGVGSGLVLASGSAAAAVAENPERLFAMAGAAGALFAAVLIASVSFIVGKRGYTGGFALLAAICIVVMAPLIWLPRAPAQEGGEKLASIKFGWAALFTAGSVLLFWFADQSLWAFSERIGVKTGLTVETVGTVLASALLAGLVGGGASSWLGTRAGRIGPLALGLGACAFFRWGVVVGGTSERYIAAQLLWAFTFFFGYPYLMGTAARLDRAGRWTAVAGAMSMVGTALGPWTAGAVVERWQYPALGWMVLGLSLVSLALVLPVVLHLDRVDAIMPSAAAAAADS